MSTNEAMIRNLSLTCEDIAESAAKAIAAQQKSLDSLANLVLGSRTALSYLSLEQGDLCAVAKSTCPPGLTFLGKSRLSYVRSLNKPAGSRGDSFNTVFL